ncbi:DUF4215 domain-containing protein [Nannocystis bainbridge]|uniref:DUF4215 domain-containing protein n=1 Tax=Nannocystis bainbridge TaxID=2995303 RepID=A0ABT5E5A2_9BACT|nr:DUF4215 domain-containing protein [Nannocystis bainbridge]MDC0721039.1 DUF4215 domain-containing protein [Nannocystis bainbridge]
MHARSSLVVLAVLSAGCLKDLTQVETDTGGIATETTTETATETTVTTTVSTTDDKPACGNNVLEPGEQCDDGNAADGDGCEADCTTTPGENCGNGELDDGEDCDDGNTVGGDGCENNCTETVIPASCGDGKMDPGEQCDDGNDDNSDACTNTCKTAVCGDGLILAGTEACDDGGPSATCDADCTVAECGDGTVNGDAGEECDDQNEVDTDACIACKTATCGDGFVQAGAEECDDGTPDGDDLCNECKNVPYRYIFTTAATYTGKFGNVIVADTSCTTAAIGADLPISDNTQWVAWLSAGASQAIQRLDTGFTGWYVLPTTPPTLVARGWAGLTSGTLQHAIDATETGAAVPAPATVWTNTDILGELPMLNIHCKNWNSSMAVDKGRVGLSTATNSDWTDPEMLASATCDTSHHLYCIEDII